MKAMKNERDVKENIKSVLKNTQGVWWFMPAMNGYGRSGVPDFIGCYHGQMFAIEAKYGKGQTSAMQEKEIEALTQANARVWIVREVNVDTWALEFKGWVALCS